MSTVESAERLINLIIALQHAPVRLTRQQIRNTVAGYDPASTDVDSAQARRADSAFERMFERDKDMLRAMGIPLETVTDATHGDDIGYRIRMDTMQLPAVHLTATEAALVRVALQFWDDSRTGDVVSQALIKLAAASDTADATAWLVGGSSTHVTQAWLTLADALQECQAVTFEYSSSRSGISVRTVHPYRLKLRASAAYMTGFDTSAQALRTFRLSRIQGDVSLSGPPGAFEIPAHIDEDHLGAQREPIRAVLEVRPEAAHDLRAAGTVIGQRDGWDVIELNVSHPDGLGDQVLMAGGAARVVEPAAIATYVNESAHAVGEVCRG